MEVATTTIIEVDETIPELPVKDVNFRIHRDIRFSKDPTPYKVRGPICPCNRHQLTLAKSSLTSPPHGPGPGAKGPTRVTMSTASRARRSSAAVCGVPKPRTFASSGAVSTGIRISGGRC